MRLLKTLLQSQPPTAHGRSPCPHPDRQPIWRRAPGQVACRGTARHPDRQTGNLLCPSTSECSPCATTAWQGARRLDAGLGGRLGAASAGGQAAREAGAVGIGGAGVRRAAEGRRRARQALLGRGRAPRARARRQAAARRRGREWRRGSARPGGRRPAQDAPPPGAEAGLLQRRCRVCCRLPASSLHHTCVAGGLFGSSAWRRVGIRSRSPSRRVEARSRAVRRGGL
jgi:hypothetical protein